MLNKNISNVVPANPLTGINSPTSVRLASLNIREVNHDVLLPGEIEATKHFSSKRLAEFRAGRACAHELLKKMGYDAFPVMIGAAREPMWPDDVVGSISHTDDTAVCVIAPKQSITGLGVDLEIRAKETFDLLSMVLSEEERHELPEMQDKCDCLAKLLFSAKESVFKCQFPLTQNWLEFRQVILSLDFEKREFTTQVKHQADTLLVNGTWAISEKHVLTLAWIALLA